MAFRQTTGFLVALGIMICSAQADAELLPDKLEGHGGPIMAISIGADGRRALSASFDYSLIYWSISGSSGSIIRRLEGHQAAVNDVAFLPDGQGAVSVGDDGALMVWDLATGTALARHVLSEQKILEVDVSPDGAWAAAAIWDGTVRLYDIGGDQMDVVLRGHKGNVNAVAFMPDGSGLYTAANDGVILAWDIPSGRQRQIVYRHGWGVNTIAVLDNNQLAFGALDGTVGVIRLDDNNTVIDLIKSDRPILSVKVAPAGDMIAYGDGTGTIGVFDTSTLELLERGSVTYGPVWDFDFVPNSAQIYHVGLDDFAARWQIAPTKRAQIKSELPRRFQVRDAADPGELEFQRKCSICHTLTADGGNRAGPTLYKVFGRQAGGLPGYSYSDALKTAPIIWTEKTIAALFDDGPDVLVPGTKMPIQRLKSIERRDDLIRYLKRATRGD